MSSKKVFILLWITGFALYANSLKGDFVFDDLPGILYNPAIKDLGNIKLIWHTFNTRFLTGLSFALNYKLGGLDPLGYHVVNVIIHILSAFLVYLFTKDTFRTPYFQNQPLKQEGPLIALCSALIFLVHPIQTEGVSYIVERSSSLATLFYLAALVFYIRSRLNNNRRFYITALVTTMAGMLTKEMTLTIPLTIIVYEIFFLKAEAGQAKQILKRVLPFLGTLLIIPIALVFEQNQYSNLALREQILKGKFRFINFLTQINILRTYLRLFILPIHQNVDYDYPPSRGMLEISTLSSVILMVILCASAILLYRRMRMISFCIIWFFITTSIEFAVGFFICKEIIIFEHYLYLPIVGLAIGISYGLFRCFRETRKMAIACSLLVMIFSMMTYQRNKFWENGISLWSDTIKKSPNKPRPYSNLGYHYSLKEDYDHAISYYKKAIQLDSQYAKPYSGVGDAYFVKKDYKNATRYYQRYITLAPYDSEEYSKLCSAYALVGDYDQAIEWGNKVTNFDDQTDLFYNNLAIAYAKKGDWDRAISLFQRALKLNSQNKVQIKRNLDLAIQKKDLFQDQ